MRRTLVSLILLVVAVLVMVVAAPVYAVDVPFTSCSASGDPVTIKSVTSNEWPPSAGSSLELVLNGTTTEEITAGTYSVAIYFDGIDLDNISGDLSDLTKLPVAAGALSLSYTRSMPSILPSGSYVINLEATDSSSKELACLKLSFSA